MHEFEKRQLFYVSGLSIMPFSKYKLKNKISVVTFVINHSPILNNVTDSFALRYKGF